MKPTFIKLLASVLLLTTTASAADSITIGWIGPLTGNAAPLGVDSVAVARRIFARVNQTGGIGGRMIKFVTEDDQYQAAKTLSAYQKLVNVDHAQVIFVLTYGGLFATARRAQADNVILVDPLDCDDAIAALPQNVFCVAKRTEDLGIQNARHALKHGNTPAAIIYFDGDPFPQKVAQTTKQTLENGGAQVVMFEGVSAGENDFRSLLMKAKGLMVKSLFVYGYDDFGLALNQARNLGLSPAMYSVPGAGISTPGFDKGAGEAINGVFAGGWFAPRTSAYTEFLKVHKADVGHEPFLEVSTIPTFDIAQLLVQGLKGTPGQKVAPNVDMLRSYLYTVHNYPGLSGTITIDPDGAVRTLKVGMYLYDHGKFTAAE